MAEEEEKPVAPVSVDTSSTLPNKPDGTKIPEFDPSGIDPKTGLPVSLTPEIAMNIIKWASRILALRGASKGGKLRWKGVSKDEHKAIATKAANARWSKWRKAKKASKITKAG